jgi:hypothetical protein
MDDIKKGYTQKPMYDDDPSEMSGLPEDWPPKDMSETGRNHRRRIDRNKRDENTR